MASGDLEPPANQLKRRSRPIASSSRRFSGGGWRAISMDTSRPPFDDLDVRKAVIAGFDRAAARRQRGGEALGPIAQHWIPPGMAGFEESNGTRGWPEFDWMNDAGGRPRARREVLPRGGLRVGEVRGHRTVLLVSDNAEPDKSIAQITEAQLTEMGFKTKLRLVTRDTMLTRFSRSRTPRSTCAPRTAGRRTSTTRRRCWTRRSTAS